MPADRCTPQSFQRCETYIKWKRSPVVRLHDWAFLGQQAGAWWFYPPNLIMRTYFRVLRHIEHFCAKKRAPHLLTPDEKIIVGLMLVGQYDKYPFPQSDWHQRRVALNG